MFHRFAMQCKHGRGVWRRWWATIGGEPGEQGRSPVVKLATWNINSVRLRLDLVLRFLAAERPDVLCLQETKVINDLFPAEPLRNAGYVHQAISGQKGYHGVAIVSRLPFIATEVQRFCG